MTGIIPSQVTYHIIKYYELISLSRPIDMFYPNNAEAAVGIAYV